LRQIIAIDSWILAQVKCHIHPFCWYFNAGPIFKAAFRDDGLIYRSGFKTEEEAREWGKREGILKDE